MRYAVAILVVLSLAGCSSPSSMPASETPTDVASAPTPTSASPSGRTLTGVPFAVCDVTSVRADMNGDGVRDRFFVFSMQAKDGCRSRTAYVALQPAGSGPVATDLTTTLSCDRHCSVLAVPHLGGSARPTVAVATTRGFSYYFQMFTLPANAPTLAPIREPNGRPAVEVLGGSRQSMAGVQCQGDRIEFWTAAETAEGSGPYWVHQVFFRLRGATLSKVGAVTSSVPQSAASTLPQHGGLPFGTPKVLCGSRLIPDPLPHTPA